MLVVVVAYSLFLFIFLCCKAVKTNPKDNLRRILLQEYFRKSMGRVHQRKLTLIRRANFSSFEPMNLLY